MRPTRAGIWVALITLAAAATATAQSDGRRSGHARSAYSYVREASGEVSVISRYNGRIAARRNLPITAGDEIEVSEGSRAEIALADGNLLHVGGGTRARFVSIREQQGEDDEFSAIELEEGSVILTAVGADEDSLPRIDTDDATVYLSAGARVRVNVDPRRGTAVIARAGRMEVRTPDGRHTLRSGEYMMVQGEEEPEIARGSFSRDRFDLWAADRITALYETRSASARYIDDEYDSEVVALDGYGDWSY
ncbi:MAG: FecR domain-containing protein, partial [Thermoanaerobaculia bacterium]|nr:FecR domain-containing protein [Thermoanaerobaculia bacterium]